MLPVAGALLEGGDHVHLAVPRDRVDEIRDRLEDLEESHR
jgi:hypothetical protein